MQNLSKNITRILEMTSVKFVCIAIGIMVGVFFPNVVSDLTPFYNCFNLVLKAVLMVLLPFAIVSSISSLLIRKISTRFVGRTLIVIFGVVMVQIVIGIFCGLVYNSVYKISYNDKQVVGSMIEETLSSDDYQIPPDQDIASSEGTGTETQNQNLLTQVVTFDGEKKQAEKVNLDFFVNKFITNNIFSSLSTEKTLQVIVFSIVISLCFGVVSPKSLNSIYKLSKNIYDAVYFMLNKVVLLVPFVLLVSMAQIATLVKVSVIKSMFSLILCLWSASIITAICCAFVIRWRTGNGFIKQLKIMKSALIVAGTTGSSDVYLSKMFDVCENGFKFDKTQSDCVLSLTYSLTSFSRNFTFVMLTFFAMKLYDVSVSPLILLTMPFLVFLGTFSGIKKVERVASSYIHLILTPLGIPYLPFVVIDEIVWNLIFPVTSCCMVFLFITCVALTLNKRKSSLSADREVPEKVEDKPKNDRQEMIVCEN